MTMSLRIHRVFAFIMLLVTGWLVQSPLRGQCVNDTLLVLEHVDTLVYEMDVQGLENPLLGVDGQGLCGVRIAFEHEYLGDIYMELISPSGERVRLIGPEITSGNTNLVQWDVLFVPCAFPAAPDPGFTARWDNDQGWGILNSYTGTYHPYQGCLEDFDTGPANGVWSLRVVDRSAIYGGEITSITLIFCDPGGLDCAPCGADAGTWTPGLMRDSFCVAEDSLLLDTVVTYAGMKPDSAEYTYRWLLFEDDSLRAHLDAPDLRGLPAGTYTICGLSYRRSELALLPQASDRVHIDSLRAWLDDTEPPFCADLSDSCYQLSLLPAPDTIFIEDYLCRGGVYDIDGMSFSAPGEYFFTRQGPGCDTIVRLLLEELSLSAVITGDDSLRCDRPGVLLDGSSSDTIAGTAFEWRLNGLPLAGEDAGRRVRVSEPGVLRLIVSAGGCRDTAELAIVADTLPPPGNVLVSTINCRDTLARVEVVNYPAGTAFEWWQGGQLRSDSTVWTGAGAGQVRLVKTGRNGCRDTVPFTVPVDTVPPDVTLFAGALGCDSSEVTITAAWNVIPAEYEWTGPGIIDSTNTEARVGLPGIYSFTAVGSNGCATTEEIEVVEDSSYPDYDILLDTLTCDRDTVFPIVSNRVPGTVFVWLSPGGDTLDSDPIFFTDTSRFVLRAITPAGCESDSTLAVPGDLGLPAVSLAADTLGCGPDSVRITTGLTAQPGLRIAWEGPGGFSSAQPEPMVRAEGWYRLRLEGDNGCTSLDSIEIARTDSVPFISLEKRDISCIDDMGSVFTTAPTGLLFAWEGPGGYSSVDADISMLAPGTYRLTVTDALGCSSIDSVRIRVDTLPPAFTLAADTISCFRPEAAVRFSSPDSMDAFFWRLPDGQTSSDSVYIAGAAGVYSFFARGVNGCVASDTVRVVGDTLRPQLDLVADTLRCGAAEARVYVEGLGPGDTVTWRLPDGSERVVDTLRVGVGGRVWVHVASLSGCVAEDSLVVAVDTLVPSMAVAADTLGCAGPARVVFTPGTAVVSWTATGPGGSAADVTEWMVDRAGLYRYAWRGANGCVGRDTFELVADTLPPAVEPFHENIDCRLSDTLALGLLGDNGDLAVQWTGPDGFTAAVEDTFVRRAGEYFLEVVAPNGCAWRDTVVVAYDTLPPLWSFAPIDTLSCANDSIDIAVLGQGSIRRFAFDAPDGRRVSDTVWRAGSAGWLYVLAEGENACLYIDSVELVADTLAPELVVTGGTVDCEVDTVVLSAAVMPAGGRYEWSGPGGFSSGGQSPAVTAAGMYRLRYVLPNGCAAVDSAEVVALTERPEVSVSGGPLPCDGSAATLTASADLGGTVFVWTGPGGFSASGDTVAAGAPGWYTLRATATNGCAAVDSILLQQPDSLPSVKAEASPISCDQPNTTLNATSPNTLTDHTWIGPGGLTLNGTSAITSTPGTYTLTAFDSLGCAAFDTITVVADTAQPQVLIDASGSLGCGNNAVTLTSIFTNPTQSTTWIWINPVNDTIAGTQTSIEVSAPGIYRLIAIDTSNGCSTSTSLELREDAGSTLQAAWTPVQPLCPGENGALALDSLSGQNGPVSVFVNGDSIGTANFIDMLPEGNYQITMRDSAGCEWTANYEIIAADSFTVALGPDITIQRGQSVNLNPDIDPANTQILIVEWSPEDPNCPDCLNRTVSPPGTTSYSITLTDENGCTATDVVTIRVRDGGVVFLPNAFTPNGDGVNDKWIISAAPSVENIRHLAIFDRWGNLVHSLSNLAVTDGLELWDGNFRGRPLNPAVFAYTIECELSNGNTLTLRGDITLLR